MAERNRLRGTFGEDAERYERARPGYPAALVADLAHLTTGRRVLEIGCGTGQATALLVAAGFDVTAVELSPELAAVARRKLRQVRVEVAAFEEWPLPPERFDVVFAATAWHWLDPDVRVGKAAAALRPGGALATVATKHVAGGDEQFFVEVQECYERFDPDTPPGLRLSRADDVPADAEDVAPHFAAPAFRRYEWERPYTTEQYIDLLLTYSGHRALEREAQRGLLDCIATLIDTRYGGRVVKAYLNELRLAERAPSAPPTSGV